MEYRTLPHGGEKISVIGLGMGSIHESAEKEIVRTLDAAIDAGINYLDFVPSKAVAFGPYAKALKNKRDKVMLQVHIGADYSQGEYGWTTDADKSIAEFESRLRLLGTDYADFAFVHCIDENADFDKVMNGKAWEYALRRREDGTVRHLGFSTHNVNIARRFLETGVMDMGMFSLNPMYDFTDESEYGKGSADDRGALYREFVAAGVGISVMKPFAGGQLLDSEASPFKRALTLNQCIQYALDKPGVLTVLPGVRGGRDLDDLLAFFDSTPKERSYAVLGEFAPPEASGACVYCNHCQPCPEGILIGQVNKYYDLTHMGDAMAKEHYLNLERHASECIQCGHCNDRCPFGVDQARRMGQIAEYFGM
ncbi:(4Fe-4S)-binding protein [Eggerthellaceae bacterium zg-887]|uniref:aldo/keto reductase n=1 Tax=Xiamenia xianingshaonis TaxID=2682776 RepID=UPI0014077702|nr:aldo/keto reductase [Xiamenia xianingshaonis]NHM15292.1 (4Fe-4S)-binding protein [Xiamenia xianingshaonis]